MKPHENIRWNLTVVSRFGFAGFFLVSVARSYCALALAVIEETCGLAPISLSLILTKGSHGHV